MDHARWWVMAFEREGQLEWSVEWNVHLAFLRRRVLHPFSSIGNDLKLVFALPFESRRQALAGLDHVLAASPTLRRYLIETANPGRSNLMDEEEFLAIFSHLTRIAYDDDDDDPDFGGVGARLPRPPIDPVFVQSGAEARTYSDVLEDLRQSGEPKEPIFHCHPPLFDPEEDLLRRLDSAGK